MFLANGFIPNTFSEWATLILFVATILGIIIFSRRDIWTSHTFKRRFISAKNIVSVPAKVIHKSIVKDEEIIINQVNVNKSSTSISEKDLLYFIKFQLKDREITLKVSKNEYYSINESQIGTLEYSKLIFVRFTKGS